MAYNRKNHLKNVAKLQDFVKKVLDEHPGLPYTKVYSLYVKPGFETPISYATFFKWLGKQPRKELAKIEADDKNKNTTKITN